MRELLDTLQAWQAGGDRCRSGRGGPDLRLRATPRGRRPPVRGRRPDRGLGQRRLRRGRRGGGDRAGPHGRPRPRHPLRDQRRAGVGRRPGVRRHDRRPRGAGRARGGGDRRPWTRSGAGGHGAAVVTPLPADSPPAEFGPHEPGGGAPPEPPLVVHDDGRLEGTLGDPTLDAELVDGRHGGPPPRPVADRRARRRGRSSSRSSRSGRGSSSSGRSRSPARWSGSPGSSASRPSSSMAGPRSRRRSASRTSIASSSAGRTRSPTRSGSVPTTRSPS